MSAQTNAARWLLPGLALVGLLAAGGWWWSTRNGDSVPEAEAPPEVAQGPVKALPGMPKNVVLIVLDTFRADVAAEVPTPVLDRMAEAGQRVEHAWSPSTWTAPSMISLFSGTHVRQTGWDFPFPNRMPNRTESYPAIPEEVPLLAQVLKANGFQTAGWWANSLVNRDLGLERGFDLWRGSRDRRMRSHLQRFVRTRWGQSEHNFLYIHMFAGHHPLRPTKDSQQTYPMEDGWIVPGRGFTIERAREAGIPGRQAYAQAYRGVVMDVDARVGELLEVLGPRLEDTLVVVTADHGELLGEHGKLGHERWLWEQLTHVPLVVQGGPELPDPFPTAGLADYITDAVGIHQAWPVQWDKAGPLVSQREGKLAYSEDGQLKGLWDPQALGPNAHVFDLEADPLEEHPIGMHTAAFEEKRAAWEAGVPDVTLAPREGAMDAATLSALEALGYLDDDSTWDGENEVKDEKSAKAAGTGSDEAAGTEDTGK